MGTDPRNLFEDVGSLSCLMELAGSMEILLLNWYRQRPHLLSALTPHEFSNKIISHVYQVICEKLWHRPLQEKERDSIKQTLSPLITTDFETFKNNPDIIDSTVMPFRARDFPLQNLVLSRVTLIHLALACSDQIIPHSSHPSPSSQLPQHNLSLHDRCYRYHQLIEDTIKAPLIDNVEHCLHILKQEEDSEIRFALEEILLDRLSSLKDYDAFIWASLKLIDEHAESIYHKALFCGCVKILDELDKCYQPRHPYPKSMSNNIESIFLSRNPISLRYWLHKNGHFLYDPHFREKILMMIINTESIDIWQEYTTYCQHHQLSSIAFALDNENSFFFLIIYCYDRPFIEKLLLCLQKETLFKSHLSIQELAERFCLFLIQPGDILSPTHKISMPQQWLPTHTPYIQKAHSIPSYPPRILFTS